MREKGTEQQHMNQQGQKADLPESPNTEEFAAVLEERSEQDGRAADQPKPTDVRLVAPSERDKQGDGYEGRPYGDVKEIVDDTPSDVMTLGC